MQLSNDEERDNFIEQFWQRRDPTPDTEENEYKEEHYRRIAYANEHFAAGIPGWKTDRGRIYIVYGPADEHRFASLRRHLRAPHGRRRRRDLDLPLRNMALSLSGGDRGGSRSSSSSIPACAATTT
jgi:GWxTD domain-containing protein